MDSLTTLNQSLKTKLAMEISTANLTKHIQEAVWFAIAENETRLGKNNASLPIKQKLVEKTTAKKMATRVKTD